MNAASTNPRAPGPAPFPALPRASAFCWPRWLHLVRTHWAERWRDYAAHMLVIAILYCVLLLFVLWVGGWRGFRTETQASFFFTGLYLTGFVFAGRHFDAMARRESALRALMLPASACEKWLLCLVMVALIYPLAYGLLYLLMTWPVQQLVLAMLAQVERPPNPANYALFVPFTPLDRVHQGSAIAQLPLFICLWIMQAVAVCGSLYFRRAAMLKTLTLKFGLFILTMFWASAVHANPDLFLVWWVGSAPVQPLVHLLNALLWIGLPAALWLQALLHLKDRELL